MNPCSQYSLTTTDISQHNQLGLAWLGLAWLGLAWLGLAWLGLAWLAVKERLFFSFIYWDEKSRRYHREWYA
jgi:hypothetical protein